MENSEGSVTSAKPTRNYAIDALRFIAICFVVYIHIFEINKGFVFGDNDSSKVIDILFGISRLAVPIFFGISGWFVFSRNRGEQAKRLQKQVFKLIKILIYATIGTSIALWLLSKVHGIDNIYVFFPQIRNLFEMFILGKTPNAVGPLWFLPSLIIVELLFLFVSHKFKRDNWLIIPAFTFFFLHLLFGAYRSISGFPEVAFSIHETWFIGFAWFSLGYFLAKFFKDSPERIKKKTLISFTITVGAFYLYEYIMQTSGAPFVFGPYNYSVIFIFTPFITAGILLLAARSNAHNKVIRTLAYLGKNYSLGVFIIHLVVMQPISVIFTKFGLLDSEPLIRLIATYLLTVSISVGLTAAYYAVKAKLNTTESIVPLNKT